MFDPRNMREPARKDENEPLKESLFGKHSCSFLSNDGIFCFPNCPTQHNNGRSPFSIGKYIFMQGPFFSYVSLPEVLLLLQLVSKCCLSRQGTSPLASKTSKRLPITSFGGRCSTTRSAPYDHFKLGLWGTEK